MSLALLDSCEDGAGVCWRKLELNVSQGFCSDCGEMKVTFTARYLIAFVSGLSTAGASAGALLEPFLGAVHPAKDAPKRRALAREKSSIAAFC